MRLDVQGEGLLQSSMLMLDLMSLFTEGWR